MRNRFPALTALALLLCLTVQLALPLSARAATYLTAGEGCIDLIRRCEGYSETAYQDGEKWYIGFGTQIKEGDYPDGITEDEAVRLLRTKLSAAESTLNGYVHQNGLNLTQAQFDALLDFTYSLGSSWLNSDSLLRSLLLGKAELSRRETARAFGIWCHSGGAVLPKLAERRLAEAALYLDGSAEFADEFCYLAVEREEDVDCETDFAVYERGGSYDYFPAMYRLGRVVDAMETEEGELIRLGDTVSENRHVRAVWTDKVYSADYPDVTGERWFYDYVMELSEAQVINGRPDGLYAPGDPTSTGEALKLILLAAGHEVQPSDGSHWASGYSAYVRQLGLLRDAVLENLNAPITRLNVARLAAGAMGFGQSFADSPYADVNDGFVTALTEVGILEGSVEGGEAVFHGDMPLTRAEVSAIVWRLRRASSLGVKQTLQYGSRVLNTKNVALNHYDQALFSGRKNTMTYNDPGLTVLRGVDASRWQGEVDWQAAADDCIDFAILRVGGRYQISGSIYDDAMFERYYADASAAGLKIGVYFYSQAITPKEAVAEADYVLEKIRDKHIDAPVVFDWETAETGSARTKGLPVSTVCDCAVAFCERVKAAGYTPMVYMNTHDGYIKYDVSRLQDYDIWYAGQYDGAYPKFIYDFVMWQYTDKGSVAGFSGAPDMDLWFIR